MTALKGRRRREGAPPPPSVLHGLPVTIGSHGTEVLVFGGNSHGPSSCG